PGPAAAPSQRDIRAAAAAAEPQPAGGRQGRDPRLPDIDEINSTLTADARPHVTQKDPPAQSREDQLIKRKRGFRFGFVLALFVLALATAAYVFAPDIAVALPNLADDVNNYVLWVNDTRQSLFKWAEDGIDALQGATQTAPASDQN
ncbi:MAG: hypothetical protein AAF386_10425, partial [Pseudomonadota bacterium]